MAIRVDQGSQFTSKELDLWAYTNGVTLDFSRPGKPTDKLMWRASTPPFDFNAWPVLVPDLDDAREKVEEWRTNTTK